MYRMLIVDDEEAIVDAIFYYLKENSQLELYKAYSSFEAIDLLRKARFDIVMTDISMPSMDGFELIRRIKAEWPKSRVIILTAHSKFDYAYKALNYTGVRYVLKAEEYARLLEIINEEIGALEQELNQEMMLTKLGKSLNDIRPALQRELLGRVIRDGEPLPERAELQALGLDIDPDSPVLIIAGRIDGEALSLSVSKTGDIQQAVNELLQRQLMKKNLRAVSYYRREYMTWLVQGDGQMPVETLPEGKPADGRNPNDAIYIGEALSIVQDGCRLRTGYTVSFSVTDGYAAWDGVTSACIKLGLELRKNAGMANAVLLMPMDAGDRQSAAGIAGTRDLQALERVIQSAPREEIIAAFGAVCSPSADDASVFAISWLLISAAASVQHTKQLDDALRDLKDYAALGGDLWLLTAYRVVDSLLSLRNIHRQGGIIEAVDIVRNYIDERYMEDISNLGLAELAHFNPSYLSRLFREITGDTIQNYIIKTRINKAKELLRETGMHVNKIVEMTGFDSAKYFNYVFKKETGLTPLEYRNAQK